jgi:hypothetical protein
MKRVSFKKVVNGETEILTQREKKTQRKGAKRQRTQRRESLTQRRREAEAQSLEQNADWADQTDTMDKAIC